MVIVLFALSLIANGNITMKKSLPNPFISQNNLREDIVVYQEDFENGLNGWTHYDGTLPSSMWHLDDFNTPDGTGLSWWMGDPEIGGYINHLYVVLDTPEITVPTDGHLTFDLNWYAETPGGEPAGYDGWDGCNVRISTDGGDSWTPISGSPAYNCQSLYSFGFEHGEGEGIPGWGGQGSGWTNADFDLSTYAGQDVMIRFAFASDPAYCTQDNPAMFGMIVDNISLGSFVHNFDDGNEQGMTYTSMVAVGGDIWHIGEVADAPSPTHAAIFQNDQGTYSPNMFDYFESPTIHFPAGGEIKADFQIKGDFTDDDQFPNVDFFGWEVSPDNGVTWYYMSNPDGDPNGMNYVYSDAPAVWASMVESYSVAGILSGYGMYEDQDVKFRIYFQSDNDAPQGTGIMIDDFTVIQTTYPGPGPTNLLATADNSSRNIQLTWTPPESGGQEGWIGWDNGEYASSLGLQNAGEWDVADRFTIGDVFPYVGGSVTSVKFYPTDASCDYSVRVWTGSFASNLVADIPVTNIVVNDWNEVTLPTPVLVESGQELWIGYHINQTADGLYPAGYDPGPCEHGFYANLGNWQDLSGQYNYNWLIQGYVQAADGRTFEFSHNRTSRDITGYNIYRSDASDGTYELIDTIEPAEQYTDSNPTLGAFNYYKVTALWDGSDSEYSDVAFDYVAASDEQEAVRDDGSCESGFNVGVAKSMAVKFSPDYDNAAECTLTHARVYIETVNTGQLIIRAWDDDGADGMPGTMLFQFVYPPDNLHVGWNTIEIPAANQPTFTEGDFYLGIFEMAGLSAIGLDENSYGYSFTDMTGTWEMETSGNVMIRAIATGDPSFAGENYIPESKDIIISNFPNPFKAGVNTTISLNMPQTAKASISVYNLKGQLVKTLVNDDIKAGTTTYSWNGTDEQGNKVASGLYFYKLETDNKTVTKKMIMLK